MRFLLPILVIAALLLFPQRVYCAENVNVSFIKYDAYGEHRLVQRSIEPAMRAHNHIFSRANAALSYLFALAGPGVYTYPEGIQILDMHYLRGHLSITLSDEFAGFGGGSALERIYLGQILKTLLELDGVEKVSIMANTPEGLNVRENNSWHELFIGILMVHEYK